jgi:chromosomal replication initiation ATPase DnaA
MILMIAYFLHIKKITQMIDKILTVCSNVSGIPEETIKGKNRFRSIVVVRQIFCYIAREHFNYGLVEIADVINKDHTTVIHSYRLIKNLLELKDSLIIDLYEAIMDKIREDRKNNLKLSIVIHDMTNAKTIISDIISKYDCEISVIY